MKKPSPQQPHIVATTRKDKRSMVFYVTPEVWKQVRQIALDNETTTQALGVEALNLLFKKRGLDQIAS